jgi:hypothetical protein
MVITIFLYINVTAYYILIVLFTLLILLIIVNDKKKNQFVNDFLLKVVIYQNIFLF